MKMTITMFRKHSLSLALIAGLGLASGSVGAQETAEYLAAEAKARSSADFALKLEELARQAAREAQDAAQLAAAIREGGSAPTPRAERAAKALAQQAQESSVAAQQAKNEAVRASDDTLRAATIAEDTVTPPDGLVQARRNADQTLEATREAVDAANRAKAAAVGTAIVTTPIPASAQGQQQMTPEQRMSQQQGMSQQQRAMQQQMQRDAGGSGDYTLEEATEQVLIERENKADVLVTSQPDLNPDAATSGDYSVNFSDIDENGDGNISREEARSNPNLSDDFNTVDSNSDGMLSRDELQGWNR
ncbi:MAG: hypothetical protein M3Q42_09120 [Pseudomonadota bacterium]|nr:hypothetical protein [Pseudomonadota bacterium]